LNSSVHINLNPCFFVATALDIKILVASSLEVPHDAVVLVRECQNTAIGDATSMADFGHAAGFVFMALGGGLHGSVAVIRVVFHRLSQLTNEVAKTWDTSSKLSLHGCCYSLFLLFLFLLMLLPSFSSGAVSRSFSLSIYLSFYLSLFLAASVSRVL